MILRNTLLGLFAAFCTSCATKHHLAPLPEVDLNAYMGSWRIIACMENKVEKDFVDAEEVYALKPDTTPQGIDVTFHWREKSWDAPVKTHQFKGKVIKDDAGTNAEWKMKLFPIFSASYVIIGIGPNYQWAAVAHPSKKFGWVLARQRQLSPVAYGEAMTLFQQRGYDTRKFIKVPQVRP